MLICDLPPLIDILDTIECPDYFEEDEVDLLESIMELIDEYIRENPTEYSEPDFEEALFDDLLDLLETSFDNHLFCELEEIIEYALDQYFTTVCPPRSHTISIILNPIVDIDRVQHQIDYLKSKPQPAQRTPEWYAFRRNLITASNAYKAFESQSMKNQLIYEKCKEDVIPDTFGPAKQINTTTTLHWGQKYEPVSVALYEHMYQTQVGDFGCIQHEMYSFLGASPDGINILQSSPRFGRMLEIKNIVNREIDGIPKKEYWIQMQLQMETCDLDECDFLETQFKEYDTHEEFLLDEMSEYKGVIIQFTKEDGSLKYIHSPIGLNLLELENWESRTVSEYSKWEWICNHYWKIEKMSCVLVERNRRWFSDNVSELANLWDTVLKERIEGYEHRAPNKKCSSLVEEDNSAGMCLFTINENGKII
jgi:putative phage-type endonuclease